MTTGEITTTATAAVASTNTYDVNKNDERNGSDAINVQLEAQRKLQIKIRFEEIPVVSLGESFFAQTARTFTAVFNTSASMLFINIQTFIRGIKIKHDENHTLMHVCDAHLHVQIQIISRNINEQEHNFYGICA